MTHDERPALSRAHAGLLGFVAGVLNGLIAIGGGIVMTPGLVVYARTSPQVAVGTSLATVVVLSSAAFVLHASVAGLGLDPGEVAAVVVAGIAGAPVGNWVLSRLSAHWMLWLFAVFLLVMSLRLLAQALGGDPALAAAQSGWHAATPWWAYPAIGFCSGVLSGLFGVGGGGLVLLGFAVLFGMPVRDGIPLALLVNMTNALAGCIRHSRAGRVIWHVVRGMAPAALLGIALGTAGAIWLPADTLRIVFGAFFLFMSVHVARQAMARSRALPDHDA